MRNEASARPESFLRPPCSALVFLLALLCVLAPGAIAQGAAAAVTSLRDYVGTYKEQTSEKRVRVLEKDGRLIFESADGLTLALYHLVQSEPGDVFQVEETSLTTRNQVRFTRRAEGNVASLNFGGESYVRLAAKADGLSSSAASEPLRSPAPFPGQTPRNVPLNIRNQAGDFGNQNETDTFLLLERSAHIFLRDSAGIEHPLSPLAFARKGERTSFTYASNESDAWVLAFEQNKSDPVWQVFTHLGPYHRLPYSVPAGSPGVVRVKPVRPLAQIRAEAMAAAPPAEKGTFRESDLVELSTLDRAIHLDVRYATSNDFLGMPVYTQARAFLQRPAAEALLRSLRKLGPLGYGLLVHDGYRPWYVTKIFWEATPADGKIFVADPAQGSRHNRGCAVDLTLYDLKTGEPVEMTGLYDEMSPRSFPDYPGGTSIQRWHRDLLRWAMESEGFTVFESEWWHFDYREWREYAIGNVPFEKLNVAKN